MCETLHRCWGHADGYAVLSAEEGDGGGDLGHVPQYAGADAVFGVGGGVFEEGGAGVSPFVVVVAGLLVHAEGGMFFELVDGEAVEVVGLLGGGLGGHCCGG